MAAKALLPAGVQVFERGWLSSNNILLCDDTSTTLVDSGYATHAAQTLALVEQALGGRVLDQLVNTHLHSDHCGGNAALQTRYPALHTRIPPGLAEPVRNWSDADLSYQPTGQTCPPFAITGLLQPGSIHRWANSEWEVHAAPGHDPHSVILFNPEHRVLISADALWENGFGVVFPELEGEPGFDDVAASLDLIERLDPHTIIPGHGPVFADSPRALQRARQKLGFCTHARQTCALRCQSAAQVQAAGVRTPPPGRLSALGVRGALSAHLAPEPWRRKSPAGMAGADAGRSGTHRRTGR